ncbi:hypothetical protein J1N35_010358 [Gossypium stocksii]|uniref:Uncharacterized protein n=1 Tax=Gossypium stocksii TaxID=47602 RepID=A0A9D4ACI2_9ROSI|nr:hypothetical protein J1N35_010358 [Gossypium stocksii]
MDLSSIPIANQVTPSFTNKKISVCLNDHNFLLRKQQVLFTIHGNDFEGFLDGTEVIRTRFVISATGETVVNPELCRLFSTSTTTKVMHLHFQLRAMKKADLSMCDYIIKIKKVYDTLAACGNAATEV